MLACLDKSAESKDVGRHQIFPQWRKKAMAEETLFSAEDVNIYLSSIFGELVLDPDLQRKSVGPNRLLS